MMNERKLKQLRKHLAENPASDGLKDKRIAMRITTDEYNMLMALCDRYDCTLTALLVYCARQVAGVEFGVFNEIEKKS